MPKQTLSKNGAWAVKKGAEFNRSLNELIDHHHRHRLNLRSDFAEQLSKVLLMLEETIKKESNQQAVIVFNDLQETLKTVKIVYLFPPTSDDLHFCTMQYFLYLEQLCLNQIPPSTVLHLYELRKNLKKLVIVHSGITNLFSILSPVSKKWKKYLKPMITNDELDNQESNNIPTSNGQLPLSQLRMQRLPLESCWNALLSLTLSNCGLVKIDESLHFFPQLVELDLSHNAIAYIVHLQDCICLESLNLSYNRIRILSNLERTIGSVKVINLSHNEIESLDGIDKVYSLERINLSSNVINDVTEIQYLSRLPCLVAMTFQNNPIMDLKHYRLRIYREFIKVGSLMSGNRPFPELDKQPISKKELKKLRKLTFVAPIDAMVESSYAPFTMNAFDFSFDEFDEAEFEEYGDEDAVYPNDYRRSVIGRPSTLSPVPEDLGVSPKGTTGERPRSVSPMRNRSVSPIGRTNSPNPSVANARRSLSKKLSTDLMTQSWIDASRQMDFDLLYRRSSTYSRRSIASLRFLRAPSTRKKRVAHIYDHEVSDTFLSLEEVARDLQENSEAWMMYEEKPKEETKKDDEQTRQDELPGDPSSEQKEGITSATEEPMKKFPDLEMANVDNKQTSEPHILTVGTHDLTEGMQSMSLLGGNGLSPATTATANPAPDLSHDPDRPSERISDMSTPAMSFIHGPPTTTNSFAQPPPYVVSIDHNSHVSIYQQQPRTSDVGDSNSNSSPANHNHSQDSILLKIDPYVGDNQYRNLSVLDNLELYFREQVFPTTRPCFPDLYLREPNPPSATASVSIASSSEGKTDPILKQPQDFSIRFVPAFGPEERFITLFTEKVIDLKDPNNGQWVETQPDDEEVAGGVSKRRASNAKQPSVDLTTLKERGERMFKEIEAVIILTDLGFYMIDSQEISPKSTFAESPLFTVLCALPLVKLCTCTIYFGFQRCNLGFYDDPYKLLDQINQAQSESHLPIIPTNLMNNLSEMLAAYMIVTRDKSHTYPISTRIPQVANIQRNRQQPSPLSNVKIDNKDSQLLEQVMKLTGDADIAFYQLLYQTWRKKPGLRLPRSIILTKSLILLCIEDLSAIDVKLILLDSYPIKDIIKIYYEDHTNMLQVVLKFKRQNVLSVQKKWRLYTDSRNISMRLMEEVKRACEEGGNTDVK